MKLDEGIITEDGATPLEKDDSPKTEGGNGDASISNGMDKAKYVYKNGGEEENDKLDEEDEERENSAGASTKRGKTASRGSKKNTTMNELNQPTSANDDETNITNGPQITEEENGGQLDDIQICLEEKDRINGEIEDLFKKNDGVINEDFLNFMEIDEPSKVSYNHSTFYSTEER
jgi:hypothetical protein